MSARKAPPSRARARARIRVAVALAVVLPAACTVLRPFVRVGDTVEQEFSIDRDGARDASIQCSFFGGKLAVEPAAPGSPRIARLRTKDNLVDVDPEVDARRDGDHVDARLWLDAQGNLRGNDDDVVNEWRLELGDATPLGLDFDLASCEATVELGGLPLRAARLDLGGGSARIGFTRPNPERMSALELDIGAGRLVAEGLGNAHARSIKVDAGAGSCRLDLGGDWREEGFVRIDAGACAVELVVPRELPVRVNLQGRGLTRLSATDFEADGKSYTSPAWGKGEATAPRVIVELDSSVGSVTLLVR